MLELHLTSSKPNVFLRALFGWCQPGPEDVGDRAVESWSRQDSLMIITPAKDLQESAVSSHVVALVIYWGFPRIVLWSLTPAFSLLHCDLQVTVSLSPSGTSYCWQPDKVLQSCTSESHSVLMLSLSILTRTNSCVLVWTPTLLFLCAVWRKPNNLDGVRDGRKTLRFERSMLYPY